MSRIRALWIVTVAAALAVGLAVGFTMSLGTQERDHALATEGDNGARDYREHRFPDGSVDVCVWPFSGAALPTREALVESVAQLASTPAGTTIELGKLSVSVEFDCADKPPDSFVSKRDHASDDQPSSQFSPVGKTLSPGDIPPFDLWVFVVPQNTADEVGDAWGDRIKTFDLVRDENGAVVDGTRSVLFGDAELSDKGLRFRLLAMAMGLAGRRNELRPTIDGTCVEPGNPDCGPEIGR